MRPSLESLLGIGGGGAASGRAAAPVRLGGRLAQLQHAQPAAGAPGPPAAPRLRRLRPRPARAAAATQDAPAPPAERSSKMSSSGVSSGVRLEGVAVTFKNHPVLVNASWDVKRGERVGLVGVNGAGKTTQLQVVTGALEPDAGEVQRAKDSMRIAHLTQEFDVQPGRTLREEMMSAFEAELAVLARQEALQAALEAAGDDMDAMSRLLDELASLQAKGEELDVALVAKKVDSMLPELGFAPEDADRLVASFSGGWQMRMCLGKTLLRDPDLLLLDEPTNHLDLDAIGWLEGYLRSLEVPMVIVSHDRQFLDALATKIVETERGVTHTYPGNYTAYVRQKEERVAQQWAAWEKQQKEVERQKDLVARLSAGARAGRASTADKELDRLASEGVKVEKPFVPKARPFTFPPVERMGQVAVNVQGLTHGYPGRPLFEGADLRIERGERVALIGPNGAGKSTLLRLLMGREAPQAGVAGLGPHGIVPNYFEQNQAEALDLSLTVVQTLEAAAPDAKAADIKALLGKMQFNSAGMEKRVGVLSGGEKARLALAKFMLTKGTLLVLDEPTNHLDIPSKEMLEDAIRAFEGAVIAVSHDRYFLRRIATRVVVVGGGKMADYDGDFDFFLEKNEDEAAKMGRLEARRVEQEKANIKAKSKMSKAEIALAAKTAKKDKARAFHSQTSSAMGSAMKSALNKQRGGGKTQ